MEQEERLAVVLVKAAAAVLPVFMLLYVTEPTVRWFVDERLAQLRFHIRLADWKRRFWDRWESWEREAYESKHGQPGG